MAETLADGVAVLADRYDGWILDIWGTLYDGGALFEGAREVVSHLAERGVPMALLSNSSRQPATVAARMTGLGLPDGLFRAIVTPGGETRRYLLDGLDAFHASLGER
ncbi:MAG: TIGR01459 family HAD-type hydrolase, partial [bacterium]|nr:TIGR01459 family HAD-type hydrolase [bacterium]